METINNSSFAVADTSGLIALFLTDDRNHALAKAAAPTLADYSTVIIPSIVFTEAINILGKKNGHIMALQVAQYLRTNTSFLIKDTSDGSIEHALTLLRTQPSNVSFTDCLVMATAVEYETKVIFGFDPVYVQHGYHTLPLHSSI